MVILTEFDLDACFACHYDDIERGRAERSAEEGNIFAVFDPAGPSYASQAEWLDDSLREMNAIFDARRFPPLASTLRYLYVKKPDGVYERIDYRVPYLVEPTGNIVLE